MAALMMVCGEVCRCSAETTSRGDQGVSARLNMGFASRATNDSGWLENDLCCAPLELEGQ